MTRAWRPWRPWRPCRLRPRTRLRGPRPGGGIRATGVLALGLLLLVPVLTAPTRPAAADSPVVPVGRASHAGLATFSECADTGVFPWIAPLLGRVDAELEAAGAEIRDRDDHLALATWAAYGSGFLRHARRGRDLDALALFDLGRVAAGDGAPQQTIERIETVLSVFEARGRMPAKEAALAAWRVGGLSPEGTLEERERTRSLLAQAFRRDAPQPLSVLLPRESGGFTATRMDVGEVALPVLTSAHYLSNAVRYRSEMPAALREVSVMLFFTVQVQESDGTLRRLVLVPSIPSVGRPIRFQENVFFAVFPNATARDRFATYLHPEYEYLCARNYLAGRLIRTARAQLDAGAGHKALKRMHQVLDLLAPVYDPYTRRRLHCDLARWLDTPSTRELSDLERVASMVAAARSVPTLFELYTKSGTLDVIAAWYGRACRAMTRQLPGQGPALQALAAELSRLTERGEDATPEEWTALACSAADLAHATGPGERALRADLCCLEAPFIAAGWRFLPVVDATEREILLSAAHLASEQISPAALASLRYGSFAFRAIASDAPPRAYLALPLMRGHGEHNACACWRGRLARVDSCLRWRVGCARAAAR